MDIIQQAESMIGGCSCEVAIDPDDSLAPAYCRTHGRDHTICRMLREPCRCEPSDFQSGYGKTVVRWCNSHRRWYDECLRLYDESPREVMVTRAQSTAAYEVCANCMHWRELALNSKTPPEHRNSGFCYRYPPQLVSHGDRHYSAFPRMSAASHCGEWRLNDMRERNDLGHVMQEPPIAQ